MTEKEKLLATFKELGVVWTEEDVSKDVEFLYFPGTRKVVNVTQAIFQFDNDENFLAVSGDENATCIPRKEP